MFSRRSAWPFLLLSVGVALGATLPRAHPAPVEDCTGPGIVFMLPGAGGSWEVACNLRCVIRGMGLPLRVVEVPWTHGVNNNVEDVQDHANHQIWGCRLAQWITWYRQHNPGHKVYVVGYSAGAAPLLAAANHLPPNSVERMVLLAPGVNSCYDLRKALTVSRHGIDSYWSCFDDTLDWAELWFGTTEGKGLQMSGLVGFKKIIGSPADAQLYCKLRQFHWRQEYADTGYHGGHFGLVEEPFLCRYVVPRMLMP